MIVHALLIWLGFVVLAVLNGAFRQLVLVPATGEQQGHVLSTFLLSAAILGSTWMILPWIGPANFRDAFLLGVLWLGLTIAFEFLAGHYLFHTSWTTLLADYNFMRGRLWMLVLIATFGAPLLAFRFRR